MKQLAQKAELFNKTTQDAVKWLEEHGTADAAATIRKCGREAKRLARTANRPQTFAVYGESQAGKSYLMGELSAPKEDKFTVQWPHQNEEYSFIGENGINPQNNGESSGLVSRFTSQPLPQSPDDNLTIPIRLLSPTDVISIIGNAFFSDFDLKMDHLDLEKDIMAGLEKITEDTEQGLLGINEIETLQEYFQEKFTSNAQFVPFKKPDYWNWLKKHAPRLSLPSLLGALSPLWRNITYLKSYAEMLLTPLAEMGAPELAFCGKDALLPSAKSILNVNVLSQKNSDSIQIITAASKSLSIQRHVAAALVSELIIPLSKPRWDFQKKTDLLDFPGGRTREIFRTPEEGSERAGHLFLRGKVDYLFQLYQDNMETTSTLLCVGDGNQNVKSVPRIIESWVEHTIGATPEERVGKDVALFFILTKFDTSLKEGDVIEADSPARFDTRIKASLVDPFGASEWVQAWTPKHTFKNTYWLRAPRFGLAYKKDEKQREIPGQYTEYLAHRINDIRKAYKSSTLVQEYFQDPEAAFDAVMQPNDGGITYLAQNLQKLSVNNAKDNQVEAALDKCIRQVVPVVRSFYHDSCAAEEERKAKAEAKAFATTSLFKMQPCGRYGRFLERLIPSPPAIAALWRAFNEELPGLSGLMSEDQPQELAMFAAFLDSDLPASDDSQETLSPLVSTQDRFTTFAERVLTYWHENTLNSLLSETDEAEIERKHFFLEIDTLKPFLEQLWRLQKNSHFKDDLAQRLREQCAHESPLLQAGDKPAIICCEMLGSFVTCMGYKPLPAALIRDKRPLLPTTHLPVFTTPEEPELYPTIADGFNGSASWMAEWGFALAERFKELGPSFDPEANDRLGHILTSYTKLDNQ